MLLAFEDLQVVDQGPVADGKLAVKEREVRTGTVHDETVDLLTFGLFEDIVLFKFRVEGGGEEGKKQETEVFADVRSSNDPDDDEGCRYPYYW